MRQYGLVRDVETQFGPIADGEWDRVNELLDWAEEEVRQRVPDLAARVASGRTTEPLVERVLAEMVTEFLRNPGGHASSSTSRVVGEVQQVRSNTFDSSRSGQLELTRRHLRLLGQRFGATTIPAADPALASVVRSPLEAGPSFGNVRPDI